MSDLQGFSGWVWSKRRKHIARAIGVASLALSIGACSSSSKKSDEPVFKRVELGNIQGKKVALVDVDGEDTGKKIVEVALVNQLMKKGTFVLVNKKEVQEAKTYYKQDPTDFKGIAKRAGADVALMATIVRFDAEEHEGYSKEKTYDETMAQERGEDEGTYERLYKVKSLTGDVAVRLEFTDVETNEQQTGIARRSRRVIADNRKSAIHLPPKQSFLQDLTNEAFSRFFEDH